MKEIIYDMIHMTQWEFILSHPIATFGPLIVLYVTWIIVDLIKGKKKK